MSRANSLSVSLASRFFALWLFLVGLPVETQAATTAAAPPSLGASEHFELGQDFFRQGRMEESIAQFRTAYEVEDRAVFLLHIGRAFERLGQTEKALYFFKRFLSTSEPDAPDRQEASEFVKRFETRKEPVMEPSGFGPRPMSSGSGPADTGGVPVWKRWWFWTALGAVALASLGVVLSRSDETPPPASELGNMRFF